MSRFIALRPLKTSSGLKQAGDAIPEAKDWPVHILMSEIAVGHVKDLHQVFKCPPHLSTQKREARLLAEMAAKGIVVEPHPDVPGHLTVTRTEAEKTDVQEEGELQAGDQVETDNGQSLVIEEKLGDDAYAASEEPKAEEPKQPKRKGGRPKKAKPAPEAETAGAEDAPAADGDGDAD